MGIPDRQELVNYALIHENDLSFCQLLASEIKHAAMVTYVYILEVNEVDQNRVKRMAELFNELNIFVMR